MQSVLVPQPFRSTKLLSKLSAHFEVGNWYQSGNAMCVFTERGKIKIIFDYCLVNKEEMKKKETAEDKV